MSLPLICRVTENSASNQMPASNLGIVFGPTLLKPSEDMASLSILMDTPHQVLHSALLHMCDTVELS